MSPYTTAIVSPDLPVRSPSLFMQGKLSFSTFLTRNEGTTDESKKRFGCYQQEQSNLRKKVKKAIAWHGKTRLKKKKKHHPFVHFFAVTARLPREHA